VDKGTIGVISRWLFLLSRKPLVHALVRWGFGNLSAVLPVHRIATTELVMAFYHPRPAWSPHILLVPKRGIPSFVALRPKDTVVLANVMQLAAEIVEAKAPASAHAMLLVNGGAYQDVGQLHFHLTWGMDPPDYSCPGEFSADPIFQTEDVQVFQHSQPARAVHLVLRSRTESGDLSALIAATQQAVHTLELLPAGYSLVLSNGRTGPPIVWECFHLVSGAVLSHRPSPGRT
jgi:histidine triad (HIT) family protein